MLLGGTDRILCHAPHLVRAICPCCGQNPRAVEAAGLNVRRLRIPAVILACMLTAIGGAALVLSTSGLFSPNITGGRGYIALAVVVLARWNPFLAIAAALLFGSAQALQFEVYEPWTAFPSAFGRRAYVPLYRHDYRGDDRWSLAISCRLRYPVDTDPPKDDLKSHE